MEPIFEHIMESFQNKGLKCEYNAEKGFIHINVSWNTDSQKFDAYIQPQVINGAIDHLKLTTIVVPIGTFKDLSTAQRLKLLEFTNYSTNHYIFVRVILEDSGAVKLEHFFNLKNGFPSQDDFQRAFSVMVQVADVIYPDLMKIKWS